MAFSSSIAQSLSILCCIALVLAMLPQIYSGELFPWHPVLMSVGFMGFMCEGIIAAYKFRPTDGAPRVSAIQNHVWIQIAATLCIILGFAVIYCNKNIHSKEHFTSLHGKVGLLTFILVGATPTLGLLSFKKLGLLSRLPSDWQPWVKWVHRLLGATTWTLALVAMQIPLPHKAVMEGIYCRVWQAATGLLAVLVLLILRRPPPGKSVLPQLDFTAVPRGEKHL